jgi:hypothetical protein
MFDEASLYKEGRTDSLRGTLPGHYEPAAVLARLQSCLTQPHQMFTFHNRKR